MSKHKHCSLRSCVKNHEGITCYPDGIQCEYYIKPPSGTPLPEHHKCSPTYKDLAAELDKAKKEIKGLREMREELCLIIGRGVSVARPVAYHEVLPWVRHAVAIARQYGLCERKEAVEQQTPKGGG